MWLDKSFHLYILFLEYSFFFINDNSKEKVHCYICAINNGCEGRDKI